MLDEDYIMLVLMKPVYAELKRTVKGIYDLNFVAETDGDLLEQVYIYISLAVHVFPNIHLNRSLMGLMGNKFNFKL